MHDVELFLGLLLVVAALAGLARAAGVPYPVVGLLGGLALGSVPGLPTPRLDPQLVFLLFLPPLVYAAAFLSSTADLRAQAGPIARLAVGLVLLTLAVVAVVAHAVLDLPWTVAFVLGAILSPTDPVAAVAVIRRVGAPGDVATVLQGEALVNDGTALTAYKLALAAVGGGFSLLGAGGQFVLVAAGGVAVGLVAGQVSVLLRRRVADSEIETTLSLLTPFLAYLPAEHLGVSGVLAAVTSGLVVGARSLEVSAASTRVRARGFWEVLTFLLESSLFLLVGLAVPDVVGRLEESGWVLAGQVAAVTAAVVLVRLAYVAVARRDAGRRARVVEGASGIRGAISVAAALAVPLDVPHRDLVIVVTTGVVLATLVPVSLGLPWLLRRLGLEGGEQERRAELRARLAVTRAGLARIEEAEAGGEVPGEVLANLRDRFAWRVQLLEEGLDGDAPVGGGPPGRAGPVRRLRREVVAAEHAALSRLVAERRVDAEAADRIGRELDLDESRVE